MAGRLRPGYRRRFRGEVFELNSVLSYKKSARIAAGNLRASGYKVRVKKISGRWCVFRGRKKRLGKRKKRRSRPLLTVHRKGYTATRKGKKYRVKPTTYKIKDIGAPGRGKVRIPIRSKTEAKRKGRPGGYLGYHGYILTARTSARHRALDRAVRDYGAAKVWRRLLALRNVREKAGIPGPTPKGGKAGREWHKIDRDMKFVKKKYRPKLKPTAAIRARRRK